MSARKARIGRDHGRRISLRDHELWLLENACKHTQADLRAFEQDNRNNNAGAEAAFYIRLYRDLLVKLCNLPPLFKPKGQ